MRLLWLVACLAALTGSATAQMWVDNATISATATLQPNRLCYTDGRDIACDGAAGLFITSGTLQFTKVSSTNISTTALTVNGVAITGSGGASALSGLTDVSASSPASGMLLRYNGTKWESVGASAALSTTTMTVNWPDAIKCKVASGSEQMFYLQYAPYSDGTVYYRDPFASAATDFYVLFNSGGSYVSAAQAGGSWDASNGCNKTIAQLYAAGRAFNFIGSNLSSAASPDTSLQWSNAGVQSGSANLTFNSTTSVVSVTGTVSATNVYARNVSGSTGTFSSIGVGNLLASGYLSSTNISATFIQAGAGGSCVAGSAGGIRYNATSNTLQICTGATGWQSMPSSSVASGGSLASLSDVSASSPASGMLLRYNGSKWESVGASAAISTTTMTPNWPDAILCKNGSSKDYIFILGVQGMDDSRYYKSVYDSNYWLRYGSTGTYTSESGSLSLDCVANTWNVASLYAQGRAFNFIGSNLSSAASPDTSLQWSNAGVQSGSANLTYNSTTSVVSVTGTVSATNVSATSLQLNGASVTCGSGTLGIIRRSPTTGRLQVCQ